MRGSLRVHCTDAPPERLRLFQLLAPALVGRAKVFGNQLALRSDMVCEDMPYFDAPGTLAAPLGPERCDVLALPEVRDHQAGCAGRVKRHADV